MMAEAYLRDYPDSGIANAGGYQFMLPGQTLTLDASRSLVRPGRTIWQWWDQEEHPARDHAH